MAAAGELDLRQTGDLMRFTIAVNFCGLPAVSVPVGHSSQGAPRLPQAAPQLHPGSSQGALRHWTHWGAARPGLERQLIACLAPTRCGACAYRARQPKAM